MERKKFGIEYACDRCGGVAVTRDCWAEWDATRQTWELTAMFDYAYCHHCHGPTQLRERRVTG